MTGKEVFVKSFAGVNLTDGNKPAAVKKKNTEKNKK